MTRTVLALACATVFLFMLGGARAAEPEGGAGKAEDAAKQKAGAGEPGKAEEGESDEGEGSEEGPAGGEGGPVPLADLVKDGFVIRTTDFIPGDAVTRQSGKVSADAMIVTLQKSTSTAVCFYTLKAYVGKKFTTIPACTVHR